MQPVYPQYPQQAPPQQQFVPVAYPQAPPQYPQPVYPQPQYAPPAPPPTVAGSLDEFFNQPSTGTKAWVFKDRPVGTTYSGIVARPVSSADVRQQTDQHGNGQRYMDGRPKFVMVVPMLVSPTAEFPQGQASWWVKGQARDELARAMAEAGAPVGPPEAGAGITVQFVGLRPIPGMNPAHQYRVTYVRPQNAPPAQHPVNPTQPALGPDTRPGQGPMGYPPSVGPINVAPQPWPEPALVIQPQQQPVQGQPVPAQVQAPNNLSPEQQALLARLTGAQQPTV